MTLLSVARPYVVEYYPDGTRWPPAEPAGTWTLLERVPDDERRLLLHGRWKADPIQGRTNKDKRRRVRMWMRLRQRCGKMIKCGPGDRRGDRWWSGDCDMLARLDPSVRAESAAWIAEQESDDA